MNRIGIGWGSAFLSFVLTMTGCPKNPRYDDTPDTAPQPGAGPGAAAARGAGMKTDARNQVKQIAVAYIDFALQRGQGPATLQEFLDTIKTFANETKSLNEGYFLLVARARPASGVVVVYEAKPDNSGRHFVGMGDGQVTMMSTDQLREALQQ